MGIDPGSHHLGIACLALEGDALSCHIVTRISAPKAKTLYDRLSYLTEKFFSLIEQEGPSEVAIEDIFFAKNMKSAFTLGMTRGALLSRCLEKKIPIFEYPPASVKLAVTGYGQASKDQIKQMLQSIFRRPFDVAFDATDALAIAFCHLQSTRHTHFSIAETNPIVDKGRDR